MKILFRIILLFFIQTGLEIIFMSLLAKLGIYYLDNPKNALMIEVALGNGLIALYKLAYLIIPYLVLMLTANYFIKRGVVNYRKLGTLNFIVSPILAIALWFYFGNEIKSILNFLLGTILASLTIYLITAAWWRRTVLKSKEE